MLTVRSIRYRAQLPLGEIDRLRNVSPAETSPCRLAATRGIHLTLATMLVDPRQRKLTPLGTALKTLVPICAIAPRL